MNAPSQQPPKPPLGTRRSQEPAFIPSRGRCHPAATSALDIFRDELEADAEADMAEEQDERRERAQRFRNRMAGKGPDGEGLGWKD